MSFLKSMRTHKTCPITGKILNKEHKSRLLWLLLPFTGLAALIWFLIRVIPKPSRATYPCQRVAFPIASGFIIWILGLAGSAVAYQKAKRALANARYVVAAIAIIASVAFLWSAMSSTDEQPAIAHEPIVVNSPIGTAIGVNPGRVAWIHDPNATNWAGGTSAPYPYENSCTDQNVVNIMFSKGIRALTGARTDAEAWDMIFRNFNQRKGKGNIGYTAGEKIAIKVNFVLMYSNPSDGTMPTSVRDQISNSPQLAIALLKQLINVVGVSPGDISIGDGQMMMPNHWYDMVYAQCPGVVYITKAGVSHYGRTALTLDYNAPFYWSDPCSAHWSGVTQQDYIPTHLARCDYFINFPVLKSHNSGGVTLSGKNHYGSLSRTPNESGYYNMHNTRPANMDSSPFSTPGMGYYRANVDLMGHPKLGGKTMLILMDGLFAGRSWDSQPIKWAMSPFNNDWPSSIFLSQDQVAIDSVAFDFMDYEWDEAVGTINGYPQYSGTDDYLHEAALVPNPPSNVNYDPNHDGGLTESLGVHEHWNNATDKKYSRNIDPINGAGIQLVNNVYLPADFQPDANVDFIDFAVLAAAWGSQSSNDNWNSLCDISIPRDGTIDIEDLMVFCNNWLRKPVTDLIAPGATLQEVYSATNIGFEGPVWDPNSHKLFFTRRTSPFQILRLDSPGSATVWMTPSLETNGMIIASDGNLLCCDENPRQITSRHIGSSGPGTTTILADSTDGISRKPNDLCQMANGNIYFTCPDWSAGPNDTGQGVFLLKPDGSVSMVKNGIYQPNGIITSLDQTKLYVAESRTNADTSRQRWWIFNINPDGTLSNDRIFFKPATSPDTTNVPDGMTIDELGNLYFTGLGGVWIVSPAGQQLGFVSVSSPTNICFGGDDGKTLYITTSKGKVYSLAMCVRGGESSRW